MTLADLVPAALRAQLRELRLIPRYAAAAQGLGQHSSRSRGAGLEFAQYRAYAPGDEPRRVDWKLYARSDRYFVREAERDSPLELWLLIDTSASMGQGDEARPGHTRLDAVRTLAACAIELALRQGDRFGLAVLSARTPEFVAAGSGPRQRDRCLQALLQLQAEGGAVDEKQLLPLWERITPGAMVLLLSDAFDAAVPQLAQRLAAARREVILLQVLTAEERDFPFRGSHRFADPESTDQVTADAAAARPGFLQQFGQAQQALRARLAGSGIRHAVHYLDQPGDAVLRALFGTRAAAGRGDSEGT